MSDNMPPKYSIKEEKSFCLYAGESVIARFDTKEEAQKELDRMAGESIFYSISNKIGWVTPDEVRQIIKIYFDENTTGSV